MIQERKGEEEALSKRWFSSVSKSLSLEGKPLSGRAHLYTAMRK